MSISPLAGKPAPKELLVDLARLERDYFQRKPDLSDPAQLVSFGTSGHRGSSLRGTFTEAHILAIVQAICDYRRSKGTDGPLYMGKDTHALSAHAQRTALEVLAANGVQTIIQREDGVTPTPVISRAILVYNRGRKEHLADGIVITPSHNPPEDGGLKYNPPHGGPAESEVTKWIQDRANESLRARQSRRKAAAASASALKAATTRQEDFVQPYVDDLRNVIDMEAIRAAGLKLGVDPLGGAALPYWEPINSTYKLDIKVVNPKLDPTFSFMTVDHDGVIRMDCSSPYAMASLVRLKDQFRVAFANDPDSDRHGIVTPSAGLMNPNHYLAVAIRYLLTHRPHWPAHAAVGKTLVSSSLIDRVVGQAGPAAWPRCRWASSISRRGCSTAHSASAARRAPAPASCATTAPFGPPTRMARCWTCWRLKSPRAPARTRASTTANSPTSSARLITRALTRPATPAQKAALQKLSPEAVKASNLAGEPITARLTRAPGNNEPIGGLKVVAASGWFAARPIRHREPV